MCAGGHLSGKGSVSGHGLSWGLAGHREAVEGQVPLAWQDSGIESQEPLPFQDKCVEAQL